MSQVEVTEDVWGRMIPCKMKGKATTEQEAARNKHLACVFLAGVDRSHHEEAVNEMNNDCIAGNIACPEDVPSVMTLLNNHGDSGSRKKIDEIRDGCIVGSSYAQVTSSSKKRIKCFACGKYGHFARDCPSAENEQGEKESDSKESAAPKQRTRIGWTGTQWCDKAEE